MINKKKIFVSMVLTLAIIFSITYYCTEKYINIKNQNNNSVSVNKSDEDQLKDNAKIYLYSGQKKEKELTLAELKKELNIDKDLTISELSKALKDKGYVLEMKDNGEMTYKRDISKLVKPNKYYIGEKDGFFAIYKTDGNGTLSIESKDDVYTDNKKVDNLKEIDKNKIKNFELEYDSKEDAEENLSEFLS